MCYFSDYYYAGIHKAQETGQFLAGYAQDNPVTNFIKENSQIALDKGNELKDLALQVGSNCGRTVKIWTDSCLPKPIATLSQDAFDSLPFSVAIEALPSPIVVAGFISQWVASAFFNMPYQDVIRFRMYNAIGFIALQRAVRDLAQFAITRQPVFLITSVIESIVAASILIGRQNREIPNNPDNTGTQNQLPQSQLPQIPTRSNVETTSQEQSSTNSVQATEEDDGIQIEEFNDDDLSDLTQTIGGKEPTTEGGESSLVDY